MMRPGDFARLFREARHELDENKEFFCSISEVLLIFMPILPSALWNRMLVMLLYILLYNVNAHEKYYELKARFIAAPRVHYIRQETSANEVEADEAEAEASEAEADEDEAEAEAEASEADEDEAEASASEAEDEAEEEDDDDSDSDYEDNETKKNK